VLEAEAAAAAEFVLDDFVLLVASTENLLLASPASSSDICTVKDRHQKQQKNTDYTVTTLLTRNSDRRQCKPVEKASLQQTGIIRNR